MRSHRIGAVLVGVTIALFFAMIYIFVTTPPRQAPDNLRPPAPRMTEQAAPVEGAFCGLLAAGLDDPRYGTALSQSGELQHQTLGALAGRWGQDGDPGARAQVVLECRRLGLAP